MVGYLKHAFFGLGSQRSFLLPLLATDDKQRDRKHPFSFPQCRQTGQNIVLLGDLVDAVAWGSKIYTLRGGWMVASRCVCCMQCLCWGFVFRHWQSLGNRSMRIQDLYVGAVPIPQFIKNGDL
jgi:hypothetical protein